ncbi:MAG: tetratricopeptide repeat protein [Alphaproteobacteria bacterium]
MPIFKDAHGLEMTAENENAAIAYDDAIEAFLLSAQDIPDKVKAMFAADRELPLGQVLAGNFNILRGWRVMIPRAVSTHTALQERRHELLPREQLHVDALGQWALGNAIAALKLWEEILRQWPTDMLALKLAQYGHFYAGNSNAMKASVDEVAAAYSQGMRHYPSFLGIQAFGHEETGNYHSAEKFGRDAVALQPKEGWATHAVAHVMEMTGRSEEGVAWLTETEPGWAGANNFRYHLVWHRALMLLDLGDHDRALQHFDTSWDASSEEYLDHCNAASLLLRLDIAGVETEGRWQAVAEKAKTRMREQVLCFADLHYVMALAHGEEPTNVDTLVAALREHAGDGTSDGDTVAQSGLALAKAIAAHAARDYATALAHLEASADTHHLIGGSNAQRDLLMLIAMDCAHNLRDTERLASFVAMRRSHFGYDDWANRQYGGAV